jgi:hypothetical protein
MVQGGYPTDIINLNVDSLWTGGPFDNPDYRGGNPLQSRAAALPGIREWIFRNGTGSMFLPFSFILFSLLCIAAIRYYPYAMSWKKPRRCARRYATFIPLKADEEAV